MINANDRGPRFSKRSCERLETCDDRLQALCHEGIKRFDFSVIEGHRSNDRQAQLQSEGLSKLGPGLSKHNRSPSFAVDIAPYPIDWNDAERFRFLGGLMVGIASQMGIPLRWGGDWDGDGKFRDQTFIDLPHFELLT